MTELPQKSSGGRAGVRHCLGWGTLPTPPPPSPAISSSPRLLQSETTAHSDRAPDTLCVHAPNLLSTRLCPACLSLVCAYCVHVCPPPCVTCVLLAQVSASDYKPPRTSMTTSALQLVLGRCPLPSPPTPSQAHPIPIGPGLPTTCHHFPHWALYPQDTAQGPTGDRQLSVFPRGTRDRVQRDTGVHG